MSGEEAPAPATPASSLELLRDEAHLLETLNRVGQAVAAELDLERVVQIVTDAGTGAVGRRVRLVLVQQRGVRRAQPIVRVPTIS